jgi:biotin carboxylase
LPSATPTRLLLLTTTTGYQTRAFVEAAKKLGLDVVFGSDRCDKLDDPWQDSALPLKFHEPDASAQKVVEYARGNGVAAIVAIGDRPTPVAARACAALGLPRHPPEAADLCRDKHLSRQRLRDAGLLMPKFQRFRVADDPQGIFSSPGFTIGFPCVLKPLALSGSRGVIRADSPAEAVRAFERIRALLRDPEVRVLREEASEFIQVEEYIAGTEVALEAVMDRGRLHALALFDKPEPLTGPFFEESIYVTPSRLTPVDQTAIFRTLEKCVAALGLKHGPVHAEFRLNERGVYPLEIAARPIGGLCSGALRFKLPLVEEEMSLEEVVIRLALGMDTRRVVREAQAAGVMMIPIPQGGIYEGVNGLEDARAVGGIEGIEITAQPGRKLVPLPEGASYLGFIFARGDTPEFVEDALRGAHGKLKFRITAEIPVVRG